jgi:integrase
MVNLGGSKIFYYRYRKPSGKQMRIKIGSYPATSLSKARQKALSFQMDIEEGNDPSNDNSISSLRKRNYHTLSELWDGYHKEALTRKKSAVNENQLWFKHLSDHFGDMDVRKFSRDAILDFLIPYRKNHSPALAVKIQALLSILGTFAVEQRVLEFSPAYQLGKQPKLPSTDRFLNRYELAVFWNALSDDVILKKATVSKPLALALKLALSTCARRTEIAGMEWSEIDFVDEIWTIPSNRTKNQRAHAIPLSEESISIIQSCRSVLRRKNSRFLFPGRRTEEMSIGPGHIRGDALTRACSRMCKILSEQYDLLKFTPHDLRRTGATYMARSLKVERFIISQILNHTSDKGGAGAATSIYARYDYLDEKKIALNAWSRFILENAEKNSHSMME